MYQTLCEGAIRILTLPSRSNKGPIRCTLENQSIELASVSEYSALSYTWGLPSQPKKEIIINGREFKVFANLFSALTHLRLQQEPRKLWIDAICINQTDTEEKKTQIPLMRYIYAQAKTVEIWLGPDEDDGEFVLRSIERKDFAVLETLKFMQAYTALVQRPWFSRTWIIQEFILAAPEAAFVNIGQARITWESFFQWFEKASHFYRSEQFLKIVPSLVDSSKPVEIFQANARLSKAILCTNIMALDNLRTTLQNRSTKPAAALGLVLSRLRNFEATVAQDRVYGVGSLISEALERKLLEAYGQPQEQVFFVATSQILTNDEHPNLYNSFPILPLSNSIKAEVPSWTLDFSYSKYTFLDSVWGIQNANPVQSGNLNEHDKYLWLSECNKKMSTPATLIDEIEHILHYPIPKTEPPSNWQEIYRSGLFGRLDSEMSWKVAMQMITGTELFTFLNKAQEYHDQASKLSRGWARESIPSLWTIIMEKRRLEGDSITEQEYQDYLDIILGRKEIPRDASMHDFEELADKLGLDNRAALALAQIKNNPSFGSVTFALQGILQNYDGRPAKSLFVTKSGLCGMSLHEAKVGDKVAMLFRESTFEMPFILRENKADNEGSFVMICVANVSSNWAELSRAKGVLEPQEIIIK